MNKKLIIYGLLAMSLMTSCDNSKQKEAQDEAARQEALTQATREELENAIQERDELLSLVNEISADIEEIRTTEKIITINGGGEMSQRSEMANNLAAIKQTLEERQQRLAKLELKLKDSKLANDKLLATVESLKKQIEDQKSQIDNLTNELASAHQRISELGQEVNELSATVQNVTEERDMAQNEAVRQENIANECFYAIGSKKELKEHGILESGFLRKTKIMQGEFDKSFFIKADKRKLTTIQLHSKKAKVVTTAQPQGSYEIGESDGQKILVITDPQAFWSTSNYVVIQID